MKAGKSSTSAGPIVFCFHDANESGATIWLRDFLIHGPLPKESCVAVLPRESTVGAALRAAGIATRIVPLATGDLFHGPSSFLRLAWNRISGFMACARLLRHLRPSIVYVNTYVQIIPMVAAGILRIPLLVHVHEAWFNSRTYYLKRLVLRAFSRHTIVAARPAIPLFFNESEKDRVTFSPNGVSRQLALMRQGREAKRAELEIPPGTRTFVFVGALNRQKGIHDLITVWPRFHQAHPATLLIVAGSLGDHEQDPSIRGFAASPPAGSLYLGFRKDAHELIASADCLLLPSYGEAMPLSISESMMIGTLVMARDVGDIRFQIGDGRGVLFSGVGPDPLNKALEDLMAWPDEQVDQCTFAAQRFAEEHLDRERQYCQVAEIVARTSP